MPSSPVRGSQMTGGSDLSRRSSAQSAELAALPKKHIATGGLHDIVGGHRS